VSFLIPFFIRLPPIPKLFDITTKTNFS
jgi:hypothetical protein